mmetsp:Transcript_27329/g.80997  ORF Transcript_27329/g.80997 Transcript_27329/m.80997 type:complete len:234 (-) Transcript_27329:983-1684(-)
MSGAGCRRIENAHCCRHRPANGCGFCPASCGLRRCCCAPSGACRGRQSRWRHPTARGLQRRVSLWPASSWQLPPALFSHGQVDSRHSSSRSLLRRLVLGGSEAAQSSSSSGRGSRTRCRWMQRFGGGYSSPTCPTPPTEWIRRRERRQCAGRSTPCMHSAPPPWASPCCRSCRQPYSTCTVLLRCLGCTTVHVLCGTRPSSSPAYVRSTCSTRPWRCPVQLWARRQPPHVAQA